MSGTSLDGLDIVYVKIYFDDFWKYNIIEAKTINYPLEWVDKLSNANNFSGLELIRFNKDYGCYLANEVNNFISKNNINKNEIDLISSHGHTIFHQPKHGFTYQIGCGIEISTKTNIKTVCDFRSLDLAHGGQGAPLVPIGDLHLFNKYEYCLNLGGIANISFDNKNQRVAGDIDFANINSNNLAKKLGVSMDENGMLANQGKLNEDLIKDLKENKFYELSFPKSLAIEDYYNWYLPILNKYNISIYDQLHTTGLLLCENIKKVIAFNEKHQLLITGGGAYNSFWINNLKKIGVNVVLPDDQTIQFKEAIIFAFLGVLHLKKEVNTLASVTGATKNLKSGILYDPKNF
jgi:anhydro-N-acetylmuramic acid kinase